MLRSKILVLLRNTLTFTLIAMIAAPMGVRGDESVQSLVRKKKSADAQLKKLQSKRDDIQKKKDAVDEAQFKASMSDKKSDTSCSGCAATDTGGCTYEDFLPLLATVQKDSFLASVAKDPPVPPSRDPSINLPDANKKINIALKISSAKNTSCQQIYDFYTNKQEDPELANLGEPCRSKVVACSTIGYAVEMAHYDKLLADLDAKIELVQQRSDDAMADMEVAAGNCPNCFMQAMQSMQAGGSMISSTFGGIGGYGQAAAPQELSWGQNVALVAGALTPALGMGLGSWLTARSQNKYYGAYNDYLQQCATVGVPCNGPLPFSGGLGGGYGGGYGLVGAGIPIGGVPIGYGGGGFGAGVGGGFGAGIGGGIPIGYGGGGFGAGIGGGFGAGIGGGVPLGYGVPINGYGAGFTSPINPFAGAGVGFGGGGYGGFGGGVPIVPAPPMVGIPYGVGGGFGAGIGGGFGAGIGGGVPLGYGYGGGVPMGYGGGFGAGVGGGFGAGIGGGYGGGGYGLPIGYGGGGYGSGYGGIPVYGAGGFGGVPGYGSFPVYGGGGFGGLPGVGYGNGYPSYGGYGAGGIGLGGMGGIGGVGSIGGIGGIGGVGAIGGLNPYANPLYSAWNQSSMNSMQLQMQSASMVQTNALQAQQDIAAAQTRLQQILQSQGMYQNNRF